MEKSTSFLQQTFNLNSPSYCSQPVPWIQYDCLHPGEAWQDASPEKLQLGGWHTKTQMVFQLLGVSLPQTAPLCHSRFLFLLASRSWTLTWTSPQFSSIELDVAALLFSAISSVDFGAEKAAGDSGDSDWKVTETIFPCYACWNGDVIKKDLHYTITKIPLGLQNKISQFSLDLEPTWWQWWPYARWTCHNLQIQWSPARCVKHAANGQEAKVLLATARSAP